MNKHTIDDLYQMQSLPLDIKIRMSAQRVNGWVDEFGEEGCYVSFSGGKDSTVLKDIVENVCGYKNIPSVFVDVPTQYPELKQFATSFENVEVLKPKISFMDVCEKYGFPLISKEVSCAVYEAKISIKNGKTDTYIIKQLRGDIGTVFSKKKWYFMMDAPFDISDRCCRVMKKAPIHSYENQTKRTPILATMADESAQRQSSWLKFGCNGFDMKRPSSKPMSFWTEQDVLQYIKTRELPICSVYGDVVEDFEAEGLLENQMTFDEFSRDKIYKTTGCRRTGCMLCGFGCHLEKPGEGRFELLKQTHPKMYNLLDVVKNNGITFRQAVEWTNEHGNLDIKL